MKKLLSKRGFTLAEMLIAVILLALVSLMATVMTTVVLNTTVNMKEVAQAEILGGEALNNLQNQLRFALNVTLDDAEGEDCSVTFDPDTANKNYNFALEDGYIVMQHTRDGEVISEKLFAGVSYGDLEISSLSFTKGENGAIDVSVAVARNGKVLWSGSVAVKPINGITLTSATH